MDMKDFNCMNEFDICLVSELVIYDMKYRSTNFYRALTTSLSEIYSDFKAVKHFNPNRYDESEGVAIIFFMDKDDLIFRNMQNNFKNKMKSILIAKYKKSYHNSGSISFKIPDTLYQDSEDTREYLSMREERLDLLRNIVLDIRFKSHFNRDLNPSRGLFLFCFLNYAKDKDFIFNYIKSLSIDEKIVVKQYLSFILNQCKNFTKEERDLILMLSDYVIESYKTDSVPYFTEPFKAFKKSQKVFNKGYDHRSEDTMHDVIFSFDDYIRCASIVHKKVQTFSMFLKSECAYYEDKKTSKFLLEISSFCKDSLRNFKGDDKCKIRVERYLLSAIDAIDQIIPIIDSDFFIKAEKENIKKWAININTRSAHERLMFYEKIITSGECDSQIARRIRSDGSEKTSCQALELLLRWRDRYSESDLNLMLNQFLDTNYYSVCNVFTYGKEYVSEGILLSFIGNKKADNESIFKKIESQKKE